MNTKERLFYLLQQAKARLATTEELSELLDLLKSDSSGEIMDQVNDFHADMLAKRAVTAYDFEYWDKVADSVLQPDKQDNEIEEDKVVPVRRIHYRWWAAAAIFILFGTGVYFLLQQNKKPTEQVAIAGTTKDVLPGKSGAVLTLEDGRKVVLDSLDNGVIATQGNIEVKLQNGQLLYDNNNEKPGDKSITVTYNTMTTPKGRQYQLLLPDGSKVWLNAASSLTYPTAFNGNERKVEITGEAYFEVAKDAEKPFHVVHENMDVEVLGTHFNVNSYDDEQKKKVTLLEGAVNVTNTQQGDISAVKLKPGQQASLSTNGKLRVVSNADTEEAVAWKEGRFQFKEADIKSIMRQLTRWYDVEVEYHGNIPERNFTADIDKTKNLSSVLKILEMSNIHCAIEGNKMIVTP